MINKSEVELSITQEEILDEYQEFFMERVKKKKIKKYFAELFKELENKNILVKKLYVTFKSYECLRMIDDFDPCTHRGMLLRNHMGTLWGAGVSINKDSDEDYVTGGE